MTQTVTFPNLESYPNVGSQALLYFSSTMGTLTEVDVVTSGSFSTAFSAENTGSTTSMIAGTTSGNLSINVPSGALPVTIPSVTETFDAAAANSTLANGATNAKNFAPVTSSSAAQTTVLTSPADLAAFTGNFRIPITISGHATGSATSSNGDLSDNFTTQTSVTLTVIYHYTPNLPSLSPPVSTTSQPPAGGQSAGASTATSVTAQSSDTSPANAVPTAVSTVQILSTSKHKGAPLVKKKAPRVVAKPSHKPVHHALVVKPKQAAHPHKGK